MKHKTVLLHETIRGLNVIDGGTYLDATLGAGGHTELICQSAKNVTVIGIDADIDAINRSKKRLELSECNLIFENIPNHKLDDVLEKHHILGLDGVVFDFGLSSDQLEDSGRGFTFRKDEPLLMTMKKDLSPNDLTAKEIVNDWSEESIAIILEGYGEERFAERIAKKIVEERESFTIETTKQLVEIIESAVPKFYLHKKIHPATKTFQALRIAVNNEIEHIKIALKKAFDSLNPGGRLAVISFHSIEDRVVKRFFKELKIKDEAILINKKPIQPEKIEISENPRSRSAKLRIIEKK